MAARASAAAAPSPAEDEVAESTAPFSFEAVSLGMTGNWSREANWRGWDLGPTLSASALANVGGGADKLRLESEFSYDDDRSKLSSEGSVQSTRVRTMELKYLKLSVLALDGKDLAERFRLVPYVGAGVQYVHSSQDSDGENTTEFYWSPTWCAGVELSLSKKTRLSVDYEQNTEGGTRRITRVMLGLKFAIVGDPDG